ncbi:MAG: hypothetical protein HQM07_05565 [Zetaproteobacteria bacterium]|nr:hypothetical protein [Zetaproteobacteria bacterium]
MSRSGLFFSLRGWLAMACGCLLDGTLFWRAGFTPGLPEGGALRGLWVELAVFDWRFVLGLVLGFDWRDIKHGTPF